MIKWFKKWVFWVMFVCVLTNIVTMYIVQAITGEIKLFFIITIALCAISMYFNKRKKEGS